MNQLIGVADVAGGTMDSANLAIVKSHIHQFNWLVQCWEL